MKRLLLIVLPLLLIVGCSEVEGQQLIQFVETYENGNISSITYHKKTQNRIELVKGEGYYENGQKQGEGDFKNGKPDGLIKGWYESGKKEYERTYKDGENLLYTRWYENGQKESEINYKDGKRDGLYTDWYENGQKENEGIFKDGELVEFIGEWNEDGSVRE